MAKDQSAPIRKQKAGISDLKSNNCNVQDMGEKTLWREDGDKGVLDNCGGEQIRA
jgi:hypothetical protein